MPAIPIAGAVIGAGASIYGASQAGKGGGNTETPQGRAASAMALDQYNTYMTDFKPTELSFISDVMKPTAIEEARQTGKANADIAQKMAIQPGDPNRVLRDPTKFTNAATYEGNVDNSVVQGVQNKKLAGEQAIVDIGLGKKNTAQLGMDKLAQEAQGVSIAEQRAKGEKEGAIVNSIGSGVGAVGAIAKNWPSSTPWNESSGTVDNYNPNTDYSGAGAAGPYAVPTTT